MRFARAIAVGTVAVCAMMVVASTALAGGRDEKPQAYAVIFKTQPNDAVVGTPISGTAYTSTAPFVTVEIVDCNGNQVDSSVAVTIKLGNNPAGATLGGTKTVYAVHGKATFSTLTLDRPDNGYTLVASASGLKSATSSSFDENNSGVVCNQGQSCTASYSTPASSFAVTANPAPNTQNGGTLSVSVNVGTPLTCAYYEAADPNSWEFFESTSNRSKLITYTINNTNPHGIQVCFGAPYKFKTSSGQPAQPGTLPDGTSGFIGLLPFCKDSGCKEQSGPCVQSIKSSSGWNSESGYNTIVTVQIPAGLWGDPYMHG